MATIKLPHDANSPDGLWHPRDHQCDAWEAFLDGSKRMMEVWYRRSGKDEFALAAASVAAQLEVGNYWHMLPEAAQARKAIWDAVDPHRGVRRIDSAFPKELRANTRHSDMLIEFKNGSTWQVVGSDNFNSLVGSTPRGIVFSEWALSDPHAWAYLKPILEENDGWAIFITTPRGPNHAKRMFDTAISSDNWHASVITPLDSGLIDEVSLKRIKTEYIELYGAVMGVAMFEQEYMCSFEAAILGSVYGKEMKDAREEGRITKIPYDRAHPVETWWDLGYRDPCAIWFIQRIDGKLHAIDYYENNLSGIDHYAKVLQDKGYVYSQHLVPHDAAKGEVGSGKTLIEQGSSLGLTLTKQHQTPLISGINATRPLISRMWFDAEKCQRGIDGLIQYRYEWNEARNTLSATPLHDWCSHPADALRTGAGVTTVVGQARQAQKRARRI